MLGLALRYTSPQLAGLAPGVPVGYCTSLWEKPRCRNPRLAMGNDNDDDNNARPWWRRPPPTWPPRVDAPVLILGDVVAAYSSALIAVDGAAQWPTEAAALAASWIVAGAVCNSWDPTAVLPSLGFGNAVGCVVRTSVDAASTRVALALIAAALAHETVNLQLLGVELLLSGSAISAWRCAFTFSNPDDR